MVDRQTFDKIEKGQNQQKQKDESAAEGFAFCLNLLFPFIAILVFFLTALQNFMFLHKQCPSFLITFPPILKVFSLPSLLGIFSITLPSLLVNTFAKFSLQCVFYTKYIKLSMVFFLQSHYIFFIDKIRKVRAAVEDKGYST